RARAASSAACAETVGISSRASIGPVAIGRHGLGPNDFGRPSIGTEPGDTTVDFQSLEPSALERFLERRRANPPQFPLEMDLAENLVEVLRKANEFVPSAAGSILLDDPRQKRGDRLRNHLTFLAAFGERADALVGQTLAADRG